MPIECDRFIFDGFCLIAWGRECDFSVRINWNTNDFRGRETSKPARRFAWHDTTKRLHRSASATALVPPIKTFPNTVSLPEDFGVFFVQQSLNKRRVDCFNVLPFTWNDELNWSFGAVWCNGLCAEMRKFNENRNDYWIISIDSWLIGYWNDTFNLLFILFWHWWITFNYPLRIEPFKLFVIKIRNILKETDFLLLKILLKISTIFYFAVVHQEKKKYELQQ